MAITSLADISGLVAWERADQGLFSDSGGTTPVVANDPVGFWTDQETANNPSNLTQATTANKPLYRDSGFGTNSLPYVEFDGADDFMSFTTVTLSEYTLIIPLRIDTQPTFLFGRTTSQAFGAIRILDNIVDCYEDGGNRASIYTGIQLNGQIGTDLLLTITKDSSNNYIARVNRAQTGTSGPPASPTTTTLGLIGRYRFGGYFDGRIAEPVLFNRALTGTELTDAEDYVYETYWGAGRPSGGSGSTVTVTPTALGSGYNLGNLALSLDMLVVLTAVSMGTALTQMQFNRVLSFILTSISSAFSVGTLNFNRTLTLSPEALRSGYTLGVPNLTFTFNFSLQALQSRLQVGRLAVRIAGVVDNIKRKLGLGFRLGP